MTEILTESFCERCGTRYTFESARPRVRLKGVKVLSRGLKNFVMSDDSSIDEAMAAARSDADRELTAHQLDAFHKTFNFCMSCRQYTCPNCWNEAEARCLTCAPHLGQEIMPAPFPDLVTSSYLVADPVEPAVPNGGNGSNGSDVVEEAPGSPSGVDVADFAARLLALAAPPESEGPAETVAEAVVSAEPIDEVIEDAPVEAAVHEAGAADAEPPFAEAADIDEPVEAEPFADEPVEAGPFAAEPVAAEPVAAEPVAAEPVAEVGAVKAEPVAAEPVAGAASDESSEAAEIAARLAAWGAAAAVFDAAKDAEPDAGKSGAAQTGGLFRRFRAGQNLDAELDAYEQDQAATPAPGESDVEPIAAEAAIAAAGLAADEPKVEAEAEAVEAFEPEPEAVAAVQPVLESEPEPEAVAAVQPVLESEPEPEAVAAIEPEAAVAFEPEPETVQPEPEPVTAELAAEPEPTPAPEPVDVIQQPTWRMVAPDPTVEAPATPPISPSIPAAATAPDPNAEPQWPTRAGATPSVGLPFLNRPPAATGGLEALWAESARDVVAQPTVAGRPVATGGVQPCVSCGLSLSATARFCRRCGTPQAV